MGMIAGILKETAGLFIEMAPYLLFGYFFSGLLYVFFDTDFVSRQLGDGNFVSVIKAALFGIPLPLCSCSVIPTAMSLRKEGASKGAVLSFLISTPTTGIDSIFATYALMGWFFTVYRIAASFFTGIFAGIVSNIFVSAKNKTRETPRRICKVCGDDSKHEHNLREKISGVFRYAFKILLADTGGSILLGVLIGGVIAFFMPGSFISEYLGSGILSMVIMLIAGIPMYVCATASIPIAAVLLAKGISPGAALVFLISGPATNIVTMTVISKNLGKRSLLIYLAAIVIGSISLGFLMNVTYEIFRGRSFFELAVHHEQVIPAIFSRISGAVLFLLILISIIKDKFFSVKDEGEH